MIDGGTLKYLIELAGAQVEPTRPTPQPDHKYDIGVAITTQHHRNLLTVRNHAGVEVADDNQYTVVRNDTSMNELDVIALVRHLHGE